MLDAAYNLIMKLKYYRPQLDCGLQKEGISLKLISWNVNGLRACLRKGFSDYFTSIEADIFCIQETKMQEGQIKLQFDGYDSYFNSAMKKGYSGTAVYTRHKPLQVLYGMDMKEHDQEGRVITLEFDRFFLVNVYTPNSQRGLLRLDYRMNWDDAFRKFLAQLDKSKPLIICGDMNVAHQEIDIKNPKSNQHSAGFTDEERGKMSELLRGGLIDTFRYLYPDKREAYTWWSYITNARIRNAGWRIDYFLVSGRLKDEIREASIYSEIQGSDHCPVGLEIF